MSHESLPVSMYVDENHWVVCPLVHREFLEYFQEFWQT